MIDCTLLCDLTALTDLTAVLDITALRDLTDLWDFKALTDFTMLKFHFRATLDSTTLTLNLAVVWKDSNLRKVPLIGLEFRRGFFGGPRIQVELFWVA